MYLDYLKEREGKDSIVSPKGFVVYKIKDHACHICELYVVPHHRREKVAWDLADKVVELAKKEGCRVLSACVVPSLNGATESMAAQLAYGFKVTKAVEDCIVLTKDI
jgi:ribosomal protein S18 acetylase RimI-like enzyme